MSIRELLPPALLARHRRASAGKPCSCAANDPECGYNAERRWYTIRNKADDERTIVDLYDEIGLFGIEPAQFVRDLRAVDTPVIELHINSPGGSIYDGLTIYNALKDHPARVEAIVDGIAASAASWVFQAGELRLMNRHTELFIHDGIGLTVGNEDDHLRMAADLGRLSDMIAAIYAGRAGGTVSEWRAAMRAETTYAAQDAVDAGLADETISGELSNTAPRTQLVTARARAHLERVA